MFRYYSTQRPVLPGGFPRKEDAGKIENFEARTFCEEIGREAWGFIEYHTELRKEEMEAYELMLGGIGIKTYYCVVSSFDDKGKVRAAITNVIDAFRKPENDFKRLKHKDIYYDWFESREEAEKMVEEAKMA